MNALISPDAPSANGVDARCQIWNCCAGDKLWGSLKKSVGQFWFRELAKHVVQGDFSRFVSPKAIGFSECQFDLVVETLDHPSGNRSLGPEVVQENVAMFAQGGGDFLQRWQPGTAHAS